jgi:hypothetical protein
VAHDFLEWFAREKLEEVSTMGTLLTMVQRAGEAGLIDVGVRSGPWPVRPATEPGASNKFLNAGASRPSGGGSGIDGIQPVRCLRE